MKNYCYCCMKELPEGAHICPFCGYDNSRPQNDRLLLPEGSILNGKYLVGKKLGKGGFGITYIGRELQLDIIVAIKEYFPSGLSTRDFNAKSVLISTSGEYDPERFRAGEEDFRNEVQRLTKFNSPYIAHVREYFLENNTAYIVMDYVDGVSFSDEIKAQGRIPWERVLSLMLPLMPELDKLHQQDLIHRDIKPENIKIVHDSDTGKEFPVLLDFGAARSFTAELTGDYTAVLTPGYAPLEQYKTHSKQGAFTDVYALCAAIYKAITGETPTPAIDMVDGEESIKPISSFGIDIPAYVEKALMHGLALKSQDRTQNMRELYYELTTPPSDTGANVQKEKSSASANEVLKKTDDSDAKSKSKDSGRNPDSPAPAVQHEKHEDKHEAVRREAPKAVEKKPVKPQRKSILRFLLPLAALIAVCVVLTQVYGRTPVSIESIESAEVELDSTPGEQDPQKLYELGLEAGRAKDYETAFEYFQPAAEQGHADAQNSLGDCYYYGRGVEQDYDEAVKWYRLAAEQGNATAQTNLGYCYKAGRGVDQDYTEAVKWYRLAADQGYADAQNKLGWMYETGRGVEQDYAEAVKWYRLAAEQGNATAQTNLGYCYKAGRGVDQDYTEAVKWYRLAADQGYADAQNKLGWMYETGRGVEQDYAEAVKWYRLAAEQGNATAQTNLGYCYKAGRGVDQDYTEAVKWYRLAADQGYADAQNKLGWMYANGCGVEQDYTEAVKWYRLAADQGNATAQNNLGLMYENGYGVEQNFTEAVKWYQLAADQGDADAAKKVKELATALPPTASTLSQKSSSDIDYSSLEVGDIITFGSYEQDNDSSNGKEDIEWQVLAREGSRVFLISKYALDCQPYNTDWTDVTWENSTLRTWLNGTFLDNAFTSSEQAVIAQTTVTADKNPKFNTNPGNATTDKVFLLSIEEAKKYFPSHSARWCEATAFADAKGALIVYDNSWWWLRSPGCRQDYAAGVSTDGSVSHNGDYVHLNYNAVRPALWIDLGS